MEEFEIPEDVLVKILLRLPVKSIFLFKSVSKSWYALFNSPNFISNHYHLNLNKPSLLAPPFTDLPNSMMSVGCLGFGFDSKTTHDFKIVRIVVYSKQESYFEDEFTFVEVFSPTWSSWKPITYAFPSILCAGYSNSYVNGACHWWAWHNHINVIHGFDINDDVFYNIRLPSVLEDVRNLGDGHITVLNGSLALIVFSGKGCFGENRDCFDLWVMNEYGFMDSWTKNFTVGPFLGVEKPIGTANNNTTFLFQTSSGYLVSYDFLTGELKNLQHRGEPYSVEVVTYIESLFSIRGEEKQTHFGLTHFSV